MMQAPLMCGVNTLIGSCARKYRIAFKYTLGSEMASQVIAITGTTGQAVWIYFGG
jgi:hypothetical protein